MKTSAYPSFFLLLKGTKSGTDEVCFQIPEKPLPEYYQKIVKPPD